MLTGSVNGTDIAYSDSGGDRPVVVLSHGYLMDHDMFAPQVSVLAAQFRVITWDERGFGGTAATGPFSYWDSARDVLGLLDLIGAGTAVLGGMSQGGFLSLRAALLAPERVRGLILIDTQAGLEDPAAAGRTSCSRMSGWRTVLSRCRSSSPPSSSGRPTGSPGSPSGRSSTPTASVTPSAA